MKSIVLSRYLSMCLFVSSYCLAINPAEAQRKVPLLSTICVEKNGSYFLKNTEEVSIGRQFFESVFSMGVQFRQENSLVTCKIKSDRFQKFKTLNIKFGIPDGESRMHFAPISPTKVYVYLDGEETISKTITEGQIDNISLDIKQTKSVAIEVSCVNQSQECNSVHFIEATLL